MANSKVTLRDIYTLSEKIDNKLEKMDTRVSSLEIWKATIMAKLAVALGAVSLVFTIAYDWVRSKFE